MQNVRRPPRTALTSVQLRYDFASGGQHGADLQNPLFDVLSAVIEHGSIRQAASSLGVSYRHLWGSLRKWEEALGEPLIVWSQGQRARPTPFAERLVWAERRARIRMQPHIEALRADLERVLTEAHDERHQLLSVCASHDLALGLLQRKAAEASDLHLDINYQGSTEALHALGEGQCLVAGFHVPAGVSREAVWQDVLQPLLDPVEHRLIGFTRRSQGLMMRREFAGKVSSLADVRRLDLRFAARQQGSGTRMLTDFLLQREGLKTSALAGGRAEHIENTHVAVALCIASSVADVGIGIQAAAMEYGLHFLPLIEEEYFLACRAENITNPAIVRLRQTLADPAWLSALAKMPGYRAIKETGRLLRANQVLPWWPRA